MIATIIGGIGLFLLGMVLLTDGLKAAAGDALRGVLARFTGGPFAAMASGAAVTALVQSSSATVLTTIGFVSAGLLTFAQAVGVIFGASVGTTSTGWIVSLLGLKLNIGAAALPLVGIGALLRLLARGRAMWLGLGLAGFGLIFVGIDVLQTGMHELSTRIDPAAFPGATLPGRLLLVGAGIAMTVVMQSSSAAVATTLTALHTGTVDLQQALALVVGQSIGTTVTAALASIGSSMAARRTAVAHVAFNALCGTLGFVLMPVALSAEAAISGGAEPALFVAAFHTTFTLLGLVLIAPFARRFARAIERMVPDRGPQLTRHLDATVQQIPEVAVETARRSVMEIAAALVGILRQMVERPVRGRMDMQSLDAADGALDAVRRFLAGIRGGDTRASGHARQLSVLHAVDHLERLIERLRNHTPVRAEEAGGLAELRERASAELPAIEAWLAGRKSDSPAALAEALSTAVATRRRTGREQTLADAARGSVDPDHALRILEATRWLDSSLYHVWRAVHHLVAPDARGETELAE